ncbi:RDD family protein [Flavobacterium salilacus subsp. salilacus]|uniref:RDD family protein n=1 Tax=Flavobacterium TaxID=237 RepID=UPI0010752DB6|nr:MULTISPECIES: RDD family protein [Flavobacterium]KAF2516892.1 RDD family protein [Flavobacterium salilacus subsp. salilacus]MBE1615748.1 RDD family protein [Flavobacterium sp. SaA2.13]NDI99862.1 RDD family protein [Flavobacterium salilacus subsp. altitudinum]
MSELSITTTQNVNINFNAASLGERILAYLLDLVIWIAYSIIIYRIVFPLTNLDDFAAGLDPWSERTIYTVFFLPIMFYAITMESLMEGQTLGKRIMKIKVIKIDGYQAGFGDYLMRWILRIIEVTPPFSFISVIVMLANKNTQRLGDMAAGTAVISLKNNININHTILRELDDRYVPVYPLVIKLSDNDVRIIKETYETSLRTTDWAMIQKLQDKVENVTGIKSISANPTAFIETVLNDYNYYTQKM